MGQDKKLASTNTDYYKWKYFSRDTGLRDYLYGNDGPWPQPAPDKPFGQFAQVLHIPEEEKADWNKNVNWKYIWLFFTRWPIALWRAIRNGHYKRITNEEFDNYLTHEMYSRYMTKLDDIDLTTFGITKEDADNETYLKCDFICMEVIEGETYAGMHAKPTVVLLEKDAEDGKYKAQAIQLVDKNSPLVLRREDGQAWQLAKYFALQGASHRINLITHAALHFPFDPINAITKTALPKDNLLFRLLIPHLRLALPVNNSVLEGEKSLISRTSWTIWSPFCAPGKTIRKLFPYGSVGDPERPNAYPEYRFPLQEDPNYSDYFRFLNAYRKTVRDFVSEFADVAFGYWNGMVGGSDWNYLTFWAESCAQWVPGFPDGEQISDKETFINTVTTIIWDLAVSHSTDHNSMHNIPNNESIFRLRLPPPTSKAIDAWETSELCNWKDLFKENLTDLLFYEPHNVTNLAEVEYKFSEIEHDRNESLDMVLAKLDVISKNFIEVELPETEKRLQQQNIKIYCPLKDMAASLQY